MNKISRILAKDILLNSSNNLWNEEETSILKNLLDSIPQAGEMADIIDRSLAMKTLKYNKELSTNASYVAHRMINRVPPAIIGIAEGKPHEKPIPLQPEQVRALNGDPIWIYNATVGTCFWMLAYSDQCANRLGHLDCNTCGKTWIAYGLPRTC